MNSVFKNTGVEWLPTIPNNWTIKRIKNCFNISKEKAKIDSPIVLKLARNGIQAKDVTKNEGQMAQSYYDYNPVHIGDLLINPMDLYSGANCNVAEISGVISPAYINLRRKIELDPKYFDYYFKIQYWTMAMFAHGKGVSFDNRWTINSEAMLNYEIPFPSFDIQERIVRVLNQKLFKLNELIQNQQNQIEKLKEYKQTLISEVVTKGLNPKSKVKHTSIQWMNEIYVDAKLVHLKRLARIINGKEIKTVGGEIPVYGSGGIFKYTNEYLFDGESLLYGRKGTIDKPLLVNGKFWTVDTMFYTEISNLVIPKYLYYISVGAINFDYYKSGSVLPSMTQFELGNVLLPYVELEKQIELVEYLDNKVSKIDKLIEVIIKKMNSLNEYKKSLIYEYVTGKKEV